MSTRGRKRPPPSGTACPSRFVQNAAKQPQLPTLTRAGYDHELDRDSQLLRAARNYYPEGYDALSRKEKDYFAHGILVQIYLSMNFNYIIIYIVLKRSLS